MELPRHLIESYAESVGLRVRDSVNGLLGDTLEFERVQVVDGTSAVVVWSDVRRPDEELKFMWRESDCIGEGSDEWIDLLVDMIAGGRTADDGVGSLED